MALFCKPQWLTRDTGIFTPDRVLQNVPLTNIPLAVG